MILLRWRNWVVAPNLTKWAWGGFGILAAALALFLFLSAFVGWDWPWDHYFEFGVAFLTFWAIYNFWPKKSDNERSAERISN